MSKKIKEVCKGCSVQLVQEEWNTTVDIVVCNNPACRLFRTPVGKISLGTHSYTASGTDAQTQTQLPAWLGEPDGTENTENARNLQRLRRSFYPKK